MRARDAAKFLLCIGFFWHDSPLQGIKAEKGARQCAQAAIFHALAGASKIAAEDARHDKAKEKSEIIARPPKGEERRRGICRRKPGAAAGEKASAAHRANDIGATKALSLPSRLDVRCQGAQELSPPPEPRARHKPRFCKNSAMRAWLASGAAQAVVSRPPAGSPAAALRARYRLHFAAV